MIFSISKLGAAALTAAALTAAALALGGSSLAHADARPQAGAAAASPVLVDVEIDPIAYAASGYSLHVGLSHGRYRLDLGAFAADLPTFMHGNDGYDVAMHGFGAKLDRFWRNDGSGPFAGVEAGLIDLQVVDGASGMFERSTRLQAGVRAGWRFSLPADFYVTPWIGVGYAFGAEDRMIGARTFEESPVVIFPTVHLGRRFR